MWKWRATTGSLPIDLEGSGHTKEFGQQLKDIKKVLFSSLRKYEKDDRKYLADLALDVREYEFNLQYYGSIGFHISEPDILRRVEKQLKHLREDHPRHPAQILAHFREEINVKWRMFKEITRLKMHTMYEKALGGEVDDEDFKELTEFAIDENIVQMDDLGPIFLFMDDSKINGFIGQLDQHIKVWAEPCLIRLSDILKKSSLFLSKRALVEFSTYMRMRPGTGCLRHYTLPESHEEAQECVCIFCQACTETSKQLETVGYNGLFIAETMVNVVCRRLKNVLITQVQMVFQETNVDLALDERICYGFKNAIPAIGILKFESLFKGLYKVGSDVMYEIVKKLASLIKYNASYSNAFELLSFFVDVMVRLSNVIVRLRSDLDFFEWKLEQVLKIDLRTFFMHIFDTHLYSSREFKETIRGSRVIIASEESTRPSVDGKILLENLEVILSRLEFGVERANALWKSKKNPPFVFEEYKEVQHNIFRISLLRNPFEKLHPNETYGYEVVKLFGEVIYRSLPKNILLEGEIGAEPVLDLTLGNPVAGDECFQIRVLRTSSRLSIAEIENLMSCEDAISIRAHGFRVDLSTRTQNFFETNYLKNRANMNLDEVEGPLPEEIQRNLNTRMFGKAQTQFDSWFGEGARYRKPKHDFSWPSLTYIRKRRLSNAAMIRRCRKLQRLKRKCEMSCRPWEKKRRQMRFLYNFGVTPELNCDPKTYLMNAQRSNFLHDMISSALQIGMTTVGQTQDGEQGGRYLVLFKHICTSETVKQSAPETSIDKCNEDLFDIIKVHYDILAKYDLITLEESARSPHMQEQVWSDQLAHRGQTNVTDEQATKRLEEIKEKFYLKAKSQQEAVAKAHKHSGYGSSSITVDDLRSEEEVVTISEKGHIVGYATRNGCKKEERPRTCDMWKVDHFESQIHSKPHTCPHKGKNIVHTHSHAGPCRVSGSDHSKSVKCGEHERKARPGLPLSAGFAEKRQNLRLKLAREKKEKEMLHFCEEPTCQNCSTSVQTKKTESTIMSPQFPASEDIDELVNLIEGIKPYPPRKTSVTDNLDLNLKKVAKRARKKERKESQRLEKEEEEKRIRLEDERLRKEEEEARRRQEEIEKEEELRKKREKRKKKRSKNKIGDGDAKANGTDADQEGSISNTDCALLKAEKNSQAREPSNGKSGTTEGESKKSEMVTIRRHATAPETTVTISVKSGNGEEDILYTLVNGQVVRADAVDALSKPYVEQADMKINEDSNKKKRRNKKVAQKEKAHGTTPQAGKETQNSSEIKRKDEQKSPLSPMNRVFGTSIPEPLEQKSFGTKGLSNAVDVKNLKLPPGITITKLHEDTGLSKRHGHSSGIILVDSTRSSERICNEPIHDYGQKDSIYDEFHCYPRDGEFEEVVSNKTRRLRNRNKLKDGVEVDEDGDFHQDRTYAKKKTIDHSSSTDMTVVDSSKTSLASAGSISRGKRTFDNASSVNETNRLRKSSGNSIGGSARSTPPKSTGKPLHSPSVCHQQQFAASSPYSISQHELHDSVQNGRSGRYVRSPAAGPRLARGTENPRRIVTPSQFNMSSSPTIPDTNAHMRQASVDVFQPISISPITSQDSYIHPKPIKKPLISQLGETRNLYGNYIQHEAFGGRHHTGSTDFMPFAQYNPWDETRSGQRVDILESLIKDRQMKDEKGAAPSQMFVGSTLSDLGYDSSNNHMWSTSWSPGGLDLNTGMSAAVPSCHISFQQQLMQNNFTSGIVTGSVRSQSQTSGNPFMAPVSFGFGENAPSASKVIQRPKLAAPSMGSQYYPVPGSGSFTAPGYGFQERNSSVPTNGQHNAQNKSAEYSLF